MAKKPTQGNAILAKIISEFKDRNRADISKWRQAQAAAMDVSNPRPFILQDLYDNLKSDGHLLSQIGLRKAATLCSTFSIIDKKTGDTNTEKTELLQTEWFHNLIDNALDSVLYGYTIQELSNTETFEFGVIPRRNVVPTKSMVLFEVSGDKGIDISAGFENTLIHCGKKTDLGLMEHLCPYLIWKRNAYQSWAEFCEKFGMPLISATTNKTSKADIDRIETMLKALGEAAQAVLPEGTTLDIKPFTGGDSYNVFDKLIGRMDNEIAKPITGGTMITDNGSSRSQSEVHERNLDDKLAVMDKFMIQFLVNGQLMTLLQSHGLVFNPETDKFQYNTTFNLTVKEHWDIASGMITAGYDIDPKWMSKTFNVPILGRKTPAEPQQPADQGAKNLSAAFR